MAGVVLETLSTKKLVMLGIGIFLVVCTFFLIGGLVAPAPSSYENTLGTKCIDFDTNPKKLLYSRGKGKCKSINDLDSPEAAQYIAEQIVFTFQLPKPRDGKLLDFSRWQQYMSSVINVDIEYNKDFQLAKGAQLVLDVHVGYRNKGDDDSAWKELYSAQKEKRLLECTLPSTEEGEIYECELMPLFEIGSLHHDYYLINIRLPTDGTHNSGIGKLKDVWVVSIFQNGGFTMVWFSVKTFMFPCVLIVMVWFWRRIQLLQRTSNLLERTLFALGIGLSILNLPVEWLSLWLEMHASLLISDVRQGVFYAVLLCFWVIFMGEHSMESFETRTAKHYWKPLTAVCVASLCLLIFDAAERGGKLENPSFTLWSSDASSKLALAFVVMAGVAGCVYLLFLLYMMVKVFRNISAKKAALPEMNEARRKHYLNLMYRFKFMLALTLLCAVVTVVFYVLSQVAEGEWKWDHETRLEYTSAFIVGVYVMWNVYVFGVMILYAPSHKQLNQAEMEPLTGGPSGSEAIELSQFPTESSALADFAQFAGKASAD